MTDTTNPTYRAAGAFDADRGRRDPTPARLARLLDRAACEEIVRRVFAMANGSGETLVHIQSWWQGELGWARNRVSLASDRRNILVSVWRRHLRGSDLWFQVQTNQIDDVSLKAAVRLAEEQSRQASYSGGLPSPFEPPVPDLWDANAKPAIWSDASYDLGTESRGEVAQAVIGPAEAKGMLSAGYLEVRGASNLTLWAGDDGRQPGPWDQPYAQWTQAQCSMTVRDTEGTGSGWAGISTYDWSTVDAVALGQQALQKCLTSRNPVAIEPGRYTVILEPQAVADLMQSFLPAMWRAGQPWSAEGRLPHPWRLRFDDSLQAMRSKLGRQVVDPRITISHDPADSALGIVPVPGMRPVTWVQHGVLTNLAYPREYALSQLNANDPARGMTGYRMSGGDTSVEAMIRTTRRGLLVTRFSDMQLLDGGSLLSTGVTRDGLWLIENGKVSKAVKNFRFTESPLFVLNSIEELGPPQRVFRPTGTGGILTPAIVPPIKARDFSFTSTIDAI